MKYIIRTLLLACCCMQAQAQAPWKPDTELEKQLQQSNHVHRIMKANLAHAGLTRWEKKKVLKSRVLPLAEDFGALRHTGPGTIHVDRKVTFSLVATIKPELFALLLIISAACFPGTRTRSSSKLTLERISFVFPQPGTPSTSVTFALLIWGSPSLSTERIALIYPIS